jgi:hypothetical protein
MSTHTITAVPWTTKKTYDGKALPRFADLPSSCPTSTSSAGLLILTRPRSPVQHGLHCAWDVWGQGDQLGTINLLTPEVVAAAAKEVKDGLSVSLNLPLQLPSKPSFHRKEPVVTIKEMWGVQTPVRDEEIHMNSQSGSQW